MEFELQWFDYIRILGTLGAMLTIPGWTIITVSDYWKRWDTLQRWIIAIGISIAFYPVLFYWARMLIPTFQIGPNKNIAILVFGGIWIVSRLRGDLKTQFKFSKLELFAVLVFVGTLFTRYHIAYTHPFPAWSDSLHHTLITQLVGLNGRLPTTLAPYAPTPLDMYHLGLYSISGTVMQLINLPAHTALLWTAQTLNGLCGLGVYLVLDRKVSRIGAITGATVVGLFSHMPAWYVNWGRFTQITSQTILLIAWVITWETLQAWKAQDSSFSNRIYWTFLAGMMNAAIFLTHFRVSAYYFPLLFFIIGYYCLQKIPNPKKKKIIVGIFLIGIVSFVLIFPAFFNFSKAYFVINQNTYPTDSNAYYDFSTNGILDLVGRGWLLILTYFCVALILLKSHRLGLLTLLWGFTLFGMGILYLWKIPVLNFTNLSGIIIMFYLLIGLIVGIGVHILYISVSTQFPQKAIKTIILSLLLGVGVYQGYQRILDIKESRYFMSEADQKAMEWINNETPADAVFAIPTYNWLNSVPHGIDSGFWIPYFTQRRTTTSTMLTALGSDEFYNQAMEAANLVVKLGDDPEARSKLCDLGVQFVYIGNKSYSPSINLKLLDFATKSESKLLFNDDGVTIIDICSVE